MRVCSRPSVWRWNHCAVSFGTPQFTVFLCLPPLTLSIPPRVFPSASFAIVLSLSCFQHLPPKRSNLACDVTLISNYICFHILFLSFCFKTDGSSVLSLTELAARVVASYIPFEVVERFHPPVPEPLQLRIAFWSFPDNEEDIRLYSCLANGSADEFQKGEALYKSRSLQSLLQIGMCRTWLLHKSAYIFCCLGFHLSATVTAIKPFTVAVTFDRGRITSCSCTCNCPSSWCSHVVAVCLHRIYQVSFLLLQRNCV